MKYLLTWQQHDEENMKTNEVKVCDSQESLHKWRFHLPRIAKLLKKDYPIKTYNTFM